ncbi:MAG: hypothetical protein LBP70_00405 [Mycoplasmataceae bacterium]|nr:hypothetical protein [Mycoplasmataceae bacterium]
MAYILIFVLTYAYLNNARMKVYTKLTYRWSTYLIMYVVLLLFILVALISTILYSTDPNNFFAHNFYVIPFSWIDVFLAITYLLIIWLAKIPINKKKKLIVNFREENFAELLKQIEINAPNNTYINRFKRKHARYLSVLEQQNKIITLLIQNYQQNLYEQILLKIIIFNDTYTTKWSAKNNYFQLHFFYQLCLDLQAKAKIN